MKSSGLSSAFGGNLAIMDIYAAQRMFGRGRTFDRIDLAVQPGRTDRAGAGRAAGAARSGLPGRSAVGPRPAVRGDDRRLLDDGEHLQPVRAVHRDVHHLQLVRDRRDRSGGRRSASCGRSAPRGGRFARCSSARARSPGSSDRSAASLFGLLIARGIAASIGTLMSDVYGVAQRADEIATSPALLALGARSSASSRASSRR